MIAFRPLPVMTLLSVISLAILILLGQWQMQRMQWKQASIAAFEADDAVVLALGDLCNAPLSEIIDRKVRAPTLQVEDVPSVRVYGFDASGTPGWRRMTPALMTNCQGENPPFALAETGFEPLLRAEDDQAPITHWRVEAMPERQAFSAPNAPEDNTWHWYDLSSMAERLGLDDERALAPFILRRASETLPAALSSVPPERHLGYALTWWGLGAALIVVYIAFHIRAGRFGPVREEGD